MPSVSKKQHNLMALVAHNPKAAKRLGISSSVGREFVKADRGRKFAEGGKVDEYPAGSVVGDYLRATNASDAIKRQDTARGNYEAARGTPQERDKRADLDRAAAEVDRLMPQRRALGGLVHYDDGGMLDPTPGPSSTMGSPVPSAAPMKRGAGAPKAYAGQNPIADPLQSVMGQIKSLQSLKGLADGKAGGGPVGYDDGGDVEYGTADAARLANPQYRAQYERYSAMTPEKLQELSVQLGASPQGQIASSVLQKQRMSAASDVSGGDVQGYDEGGGVMGMGEAMPWWSRRQSNQVDANKSGFLKSTIPGRTDHIPTQAPAGSYVVPADVISGLGEGNSLAGAKVMQEILKSGPWGTTPGRVHGGRGPPSAPSGRTPPEALATGGDVGQPTKILAAGGEHIVHPDDVKRIGGGNLNRGHKVLDKWVVHERRKIAKKMLSLPGPKK